MAYHNTIAEAPETGGAVALRRRSAAPARVLGALHEAARNMFGLDYRSLALLRIGMGLCLLWVAIAHGSEMRAFYSDQGVLPRAAVFDNPADLPGFSLYFAAGSLPYIGVLFAVQIVLALMMVVGYRTRLATIGSYIFLLSMQNRQPLLIFGADIALRVGLFWTIFLPLSRRFSLDRFLGLIAPPVEQSYLSLAGVAFIAQVCMIYTIGALMKSGPTWHVNHSAVALALAVEMYSRPLGHWLGQFDGLTAALTVFTLYLELYGPALFILPVFSSWGRVIGFLLFAGLQIGFGLCMTMGIFGPVMIALTLALLPPCFWERIAEPLGRKLASRLRSIAPVDVSAGLWVWLRHRRGQTPRRVGWPVYFRALLMLLRDGALALLLALTVLWNIGNLPGQPWRLSPKLDALAYTVGLDQLWNMFAPDPLPIDGWFVVTGYLRNGQTVDLFSGARPVSFDKPASVAASYRNQLWMCYLISLWDADGNSAGDFAQYLHKTWNEGHLGDEQLKSIEIDVMQETIGLGLEHSAPEREVIWTQRF